jgi:hypothetical protein
MGAKMARTGLHTMQLHSYDEFQTWLAKDLEVREELYAIMGNELDPEVESLDELEAFLLARYASSTEALRLNERGILDAAARHLGLVMILNIEGAQWAVDFDDEDNTFYRLPVIRLDDGPEQCPVAMITTTLNRRTGHILRSAVESNVED